VDPLFGANHDQKRNVCSHLSCGRVNDRVFMPGCDGLCERNLEYPGYADNNPSGEYLAVQSVLGPEDFAAKRCVNRIRVRVGSFVDGRVLHFVCL
jgi:hypothetical protein